MIYRYEISGTAAEGQTWATSGEVETTPGAFLNVPVYVLGEAFGTLAKGKAVYGKPDVRCDVPYQVTRFLVEVKHNA